MTLPGHRRIVGSFVLLMVGAAAGDQLEQQLASLDPSVLDRISATMLAGIGPERDADPARIAGNRLRSIVHELAAQGRRTTPAAPMAALAAIRLDAVMPDLQARLNRLSDLNARIGDPPRILDPETRARIQSRLRVFNSMALDELRRRSTGAVADLDEALGLILAPIRDVLETTSGRVLRTRWPERSASDAADHGTDPLAESPESLDSSWATSRPDFDGSSVDARRISELAERLDRIEDHRTDEVATLNELLREVATRIATRNPATDDADRMALLELCVANLEAEIALEASAISGDFRTFHRRYVDRSRRIRKRMFDETPSRSARADPRLPTELAAATADLRALEVAYDLRHAIQMLVPPESLEAAARLRTWLRDLDRDTTRARARERFDRLGNQLAQHLPCPGERSISDPGRSPDDLLAGRGPDLLVRLQNARHGWAREIAAGVLDGPSSLELDRLRRLLRIVHDSEPLLRNRSDTERPLEIPGHWAGSYLDPESMSWTLRSLRPGILLAVNAAADGRESRLSSDLERLERILPMVRLTAHLCAEFDSALPDVPAGGLGAIAALSFPPSATARGIEQRRSLAIVSRGVAEIAAARARGDAKLADHLADELSDVVTPLLLELQDSASLPTPLMETDR